MKIDRSIPLQKNDTASADQKIRDVSKMYEQYFLDEMVKSMRNTVDHSKMNAPSMAEKIYSGQLDNQIVENWADRGGVGLADIIFNQLKERFFQNGSELNRPEGPIPLKSGTQLKIDETQNHGLPIVTPKSTIPGNEVSFLLQWDNQTRPQESAVRNPFSGDVLQSFRTMDQRQILKISHDNGLQSTISFLGEAQNLDRGDKIAAGQRLGVLSPEAMGLTWQVGEVGT